jgi:hypothetical protein
MSPAEPGNLVSLQPLYLSSSQLSGSVPAALGNLTSLHSLGPSSSQLSGSIPAALGNFASLQSLDLSSNQLSRSVHAALGNLTSLHSLDLSSSQLSGSIPAALGNLTSLRFLDLSYIFAIFGSELKLSVVATFYNRFRDAIFVTHVSSFTVRCHLLSLEIWYLCNLCIWARINCQDPFLLHLGKLDLFAIFGLSSNQLSGSIPAALERLTSWQSLNLSSNQLSGSIPSALGNRTSFEYLYLSSNRLSGLIPLAKYTLLWSGFPWQTLQMVRWLAHLSLHELRVKFSHLCDSISDGG